MVLMMIVETVKMEKEVEIVETVTVLRKSRK